MIAVCASLEIPVASDIPPSAIFEGTFPTAFAPVASASPVAFAPCVAHFTSAFPACISALVTFAAHFIAASATFGDAFTPMRFKAPSAVNPVSLMSCLVFSSCELYHSCTFANHSFAKSLTTCGVSMEAAGAMLHSIACQATPETGENTTPPTQRVRPSISGRPIFFHSARPSFIW